jgi:malonyl-CoA O-methyltransferase
VTTAPVFVDVRQVRRAADRAAAGYSAHAEIEREIGRRMLERLDYVTIEPAWIVDLGSGPDMATAALHERYRDAGILSVDLSERMLRAGEAERRGLRYLLPQFRSLFGGQRGSRKLCADAARLPVKSGIAQLAWSNLMLHWCNDPVAVIAETHRVLAVGGLAMFTTFGPDTLKELRNAFADGMTHTQRFIDMHDWGDMLVHAGFADPVMDMEVLTLEYESLDRLFGDLRAGGAGNAMQDRPRGLSGKASWRTARSRLDAARRNGKLPVTLEVVYGHAWKAAPKKTADGRAVIGFRKRPG